MLHLSGKSALIVIKKIADPIFYCSITTKSTIMSTKPKKAFLLSIMLLVILSLSYAVYLIPGKNRTAVTDEHISCTPEKHVCVMKTIFGLENKETGLKSFHLLDISAEVKGAISAGLDWMAKAQAGNGGWGAGMHSQQDIRDPHAVNTDPATTSLVAMSLLRTGNSLDSGAYKNQIVKATEYLLKEVEEWKPDQPRLTSLTGTQPQQKLGENIDAILTVQYFTTLLKYHQQHVWKERIEKALQKCVTRIEKEQDGDGSWKGGGWAPVLQSALADQALESAKEAGANVNDEVLNKSKTYQKSNFDTATKSAVTGKAAGIMLYSLSSTTRSSAKEAKKAKGLLSKAKQEGKLKAEDELSEENLVKAGATPAEAKELVTANMINQSTQDQSTNNEVMSGYGSNGGEELLSYLMTGESIMMQGGEAWKKWYDDMSKRILSIQKRDGSWEGHHCITSPVFCTATALLILSIHNDMDITIQKGF